MTDAFNPLELDDDHPDWYAFAECRGLTTAQRDDIFFPASGTHTSAAKAICNVCPVRSECLEHALASNEKYGIWGGKSERERRRIRRMRRGDHAA